MPISLPKTLTTILTTLLLYLLAPILVHPLHAQTTYSIFHAVTSTSSTAIAVANASTHDAVVRFPSVIVSCSGACAIRVYEGGTTTTTLSATYPRATKANNTYSVLSGNKVKFYTAANSSSGTIIGGGDCEAACVWPITGQLPDRNNRHSMELARKTNDQYYIVVTGSSIDVVFSGVIEVVR